MANEVTVNASLAHQTQTASNKSTSVSVAGPANQQVSQSGSGKQRVVKGVAQVATTAGGVAIDIGDLGGGTLGFAMFRNLDTTNFVELWTAVTGSGGKIFATMKAGESCGPLRLGSDASAIAWRADTAICSVEFEICEA